MLVLLLAAVSHSWWLGKFGEFLVAAAPASPADVALVLGGDHRLQQAADLVASETVSQVWLIEREPSYAVQAGILPAVHDTAFKELVSMGVLAEQIRVLRGQAREYEEAAHIVARELTQRPDARVVVLCHRLHGRNVRTVFSQVLSGPQSASMSVLGLPADEFDEHDWWLSRTGWKETFTAMSDLMFTLVVGIQPPRERKGFDPDAYERQLISQFREAACHAE